MILRVELNGTNENRYLRLYGLTQNPFPQIAKAELMGAMKQLNSLAGEPIKTKEEIADRLPNWSKEFVELCQSNFKVGEWGKL